MNGYAENTYVDSGGQVYVNAGNNSVADPGQGGQIINTTVGTGGLVVTPSRPHQGELWVQALSNRFDVNRTGNTAYRQRLGGLMMGYDKNLPHQTGLLTLGIAGGYSRSDLDLANNSDGSVDSYSAALYASYYDQSRFWLDAMLKGNLFNQHLKCPHEFRWSRRRQFHHPRSGWVSDCRV
ncbi:autotransporter outer membrane beta-barrel domain-containing protein [Citrobacter amalonaticus]|uniref:autotransporter outer membrane beta-barrel domain-containing protein n=1 Tax=Citrobacter amalonaticus TaxID=35703 RepID=UPI0021563B2B|nr:autotransporter outer membrane beta-barrel domain-containing protein [Citrobacter amalonaticus]